MKISRLHYLTQDLQHLSHVDLVRQICGNSELEWLQLRIKDASELERFRIVQECVPICKLYNVKLILNDNVEIAERLDVDGVHLGENDMPIEEARAILGYEKIIGGTANSYEDIEKLHAAGVDYIGLGPFKFTKTKKNLSEILNLQGYIDIVKRCRLANIQTPLIAIGGIQVNDVQQLMQAGVYGVAVSSAINLSSDRVAKVNEFFDTINQSVAMRN